MTKEIDSDPVVDYVSYGDDGRIHQTGRCHTSMLKHQYHPEGGGVMLGAAEGAWDTHYVRGNKIVQMDKRPTMDHTFDFQTKRWEDKRTLSEAKAQQWASIKKSRELAKVGGFIVQDEVFDSNSASQQAILLACQEAAVLGESFSKTWVLQNNDTTQLDAIEMAFVGSKLSEFLSNIQTKSQKLREALDACTSLAEVKEVVW